MKQKPENRIKQLEAEVVEGKTILSCIHLMDLSKDFPEPMKQRILAFLDIKPEAKP